MDKNMSINIDLIPQEMTKEVMMDLEKRGLIIRLCPGNHRLDVENGEGKGEFIYTSDKQYGPHSLVNVAIDNTTFSSFGIHPDNEEFLLLGGKNEKQLYLLIALCENEEFNKKISEKSIGTRDFTCLEVTYNNPEVSFFTMLKNIPHGEAVRDEEGLAATFYVTEPREMPLVKSDLKDYIFRICEE
jgi:hypothetical protein